MSKPVKIGIVGGRRGRTYNYAFHSFPERVALTAICDLSEEILATWREEFPGTVTFSSYEDMLEKGDCDAVFVATPMLIHARQSIQALNAGKHVLSAVEAASTLDECWELVETAEATRLTYMMEETQTYRRDNMMVQNMVDHDVFGAITYAEGAYIANNNNAMFQPDGSLAWRGEMARTYRGNTYPTHSIGPLAQWLRINRPGGDRFVSTAAWLTTSASRRRFSETNLGPDHPAAKEGYFVRPDMALTLVRTAKDVVILTKTDAGSARPRGGYPNHLQGTTAAYYSLGDLGDDPLVWIEGRSPASPNSIPLEWEKLWDYAGEYEHPRWRKWERRAPKTGQSGLGFLSLLDFAHAVQTGQPPPIDVYDAVTWGSLIPLSIESWNNGGAPVDVPDFARNRTAGQRTS